MLTPERKKKNGIFHEFMNKINTKAYHDRDSGPGSDGIVGSFT